MTPRDELQTRLGYYFSNTELLEEALTHPSVRHSSSTRGKDNQRLEFLGDAVLQLAATIHLYRNLPQADEGRLTKMRSRLTNRLTLARLARKISLGEFLVLGKGEEASGGRNRLSNLADAYEAVLAAIYLDGGLEAASRFALAQWEPELAAPESFVEIENPKGRLQEILQASSSAGPTYKIVRQAGPDHAREFEAVVQFEGRDLGHGIGASKKEAETRAAEAALERLGTLNG